MNYLFCEHKIKFGKSTGKENQDKNIQEESGKQSNNTDKIHNVETSPCAPNTKFPNSGLFEEHVQRNINNRPNYHHQICPRLTRRKKTLTASEGRWRGINNGQSHLKEFFYSSTCDNCLRGQSSLKGTLSHVFDFRLVRKAQKFSALCLPYKILDLKQRADQWKPYSCFTKMRYKGYGSSIPFFPYLSHIVLIVLWMMITMRLCSGMSPPPNYSQANMPVTNFTCDDKATGGYYADPEAGCQMFHVCVRISDEKMNDYKFLCPNDTVFDQQNFICTNWWEINCEKSTRYYSKNDLFRVRGDETPTEYEYENTENLESPAYYEYVYEYDDQEVAPVSTGTPIAPENNSRGNQHRFTLGKSKHETSRGRAIETTYKQSTKSSATSSTTTRPATQVVTRKAKHVQIVHFQRPTSLPLTSDRRTSTPVFTTLSPHFNIEANHNSNSKDDHGTQHSVKSHSKKSPGVGHNISRGKETFLSRLHEEEEQKRKLERDRKDAVSGSDDPFANYDWKRDSNGVTSSAKTRYEALFGSTSSRGREFNDSHKKQIIEQRHLNKGISQNTNPQPSTQGHNHSTRQTATNRRAAKHLRISHGELNRPQTSPQTNPQANHQANHQTKPQLPESKHKEFSNFRFYKTAFGRSYSSNDFLGTTGTTAAPLRLSNPVRPERTASRNTRYSVYG